MRFQGCPDACANPQKYIVNRMVRDGSSDEEIFQAMLRRTGYDRRVIADTQGGAGQLVRVLPLLFLGFGVLLVAVVLLSWKRGGSSAKEVRQQQKNTVSDGELAQVERELAELE